MTRPVEDWARRAAQLPAVLVHATPDAVRTGADVLAESTRTSLRTASGGDLRLSRVRSGKGARVDVDVKLRGAGADAQARVVPIGPVSLLEGTRRHTEPFGYSGTTGAGGRRRYATEGQALAGGGIARRKRAARRGFLWIPGVGFRLYAKHPGTRGRSVMGPAMHTHGDEAGRAGAEVFTEAVRRHLAG